MEWLLITVRREEHPPIARLLVAHRPHSVQLWPEARYAQRHPGWAGIAGVSRVGLLAALNDGPLLAGSGQMSRPGAGYWLEVLFVIAGALAPARSLL